MVQIVAATADSRNPCFAWADIDGHLLSAQLCLLRAGFPALTVPGTPANLWLRTSPLRSGRLAVQGGL